MNRREKQLKWDRRYLALADYISQWSEDRSTKVGAVIVGPNNRVVSVGYNGFPSGVEDKPERHERPEKYQYTEHAERNAIYNAKMVPEGSTLYLNWELFPCADCTRAIIQSGIKRVVGVKGKSFPGKGNGTHYHTSGPSEEMLREAGVEVVDVEIEQQ